jgi:hypothetical protein
MEPQTQESITPIAIAPDAAVAPAPTMLQAQLGAGLDTVERMAAIQRAGDEEKVQRVRKNLEPFIQKARALKAEFTAILQDHAALLDRLQGLDIPILRTFHGYNLLGDLAEDAKQFRLGITDLMGHLDRAVTRAENFCFKDFGTHATHELGELVEGARTGPERAIEKLRAFKERLDKFTAAQQR